MCVNTLQLGKSTLGACSPRKFFNLKAMRLLRPFLGQYNVFQREDNRVLLASSLDPSGVGRGLGEVAGDEARVSHA